MKKCRVKKLHSKFYDKTGAEIDVHEWAKLKANHLYSKLKDTILEDGKWISTVWLGMDQVMGQGNNFETMVFPSRGQDIFTELDCNRYTTELDAVAGHEEMCLKWASFADLRFEWNRLEL